jgi:hypothetical protein
MALLEAYSWPGNVRELRNVIERAALLAQGRTIGVARPGKSSLSRGGAGPSPALGTENGLPTLDLAELERLAIEHALERTGWHQGQAADILGVSARTLHRKIQGLRPPAARAPRVSRLRAAAAIHAGTEPWSDATRWLTERPRRSARASRAPSAPSARRRCASSLPDAEPVPRTTFDAVVARRRERARTPTASWPSRTRSPERSPRPTTRSSAATCRWSRRRRSRYATCLLGHPRRDRRGAARGALPSRRALAVPRASSPRTPASAPRPSTTPPAPPQEVAEAGDPTTRGDRLPARRRALRTRGAAGRPPGPRRQPDALLPHRPEAGPSAGPASGPLKTACVAELENRPGSLHALLGVFAELGLDLSHVASRPAASPWTYRFIIEFTHATVGEASRALEAATPLCARLHLLGTFPARKPSERAAPPRREA